MNAHTVQLCKSFGTHNVKAPNLFLRNEAKPALLSNSSLTKASRGEVVGSIPHASCLERMFRIGLWNVLGASVFDRLLTRFACGIIFKSEFQDDETISLLKIRQSVLLVPMFCLAFTYGLDIRNARCTTKRTTNLQ